MEYLKIFVPATVANVSCGFDSLGFAVEAIGDEMTFTRTAEKGVKITTITIHLLRNWLFFYLYCTKPQRHTCATF